jgi:hypothetical protein
MSNTTKRFSERDANQTLQSSYNDVDASLTTNGFLVGKVGRKIEPVISTTTVANDTITYYFSENGQQLYAYEIIYTDGTRSTMISAERIS